MLMFLWYLGLVFHFFGVSRACIFHVLVVSGTCLDYVLVVSGACFAHVFVVSRACFAYVFVVSGAGSVPEHAIARDNDSTLGHDKRVETLNPKRVV